MSDQKTKNKLDLDYNKYCQYVNSSIVIFATIFISAILAVLTKQIEIGNNTPFMAILGLIIAAICLTVFAIVKLHNRMENIKKKIDLLDI